MSHQSDLIAEDILGYLKQHEAKDLLRLITCGSVDDGKSTLIGRLLHDSKLIYEDQLASITRDSQRFNTTDQEVDLALLVDGLQAEREQGITIDVAYRYFSTDRRKFIIADCPGHEQYTRNMVTGASTCNLAVILIDARYGLQIQTRRHSYLVDQLGIRHVVVAVNKMDLVDYSEAVYKTIQSDYLKFADRLSIPDVQFVPISALKGDQVVTQGVGMPWYTGPTLMQILEQVELTHDIPLDELRLPVQLVIRPNLDFRGFAGTLAAGSLRVGDMLQVLPNRQQAKVQQLLVAGVDAEVAQAGQSVAVTLDREIDVSRGDMLVQAQDSAAWIAQNLEVQVVWMQDTPLRPGQEYLIKQGERIIPGQVDCILYRININTLEHELTDQLQLNEVGLCRLHLHQPVVADAYRRCRGTGSLIFIDRSTYATAGAAMIQAQVEQERCDTPELDQESELQRLRSFEKELNRLVRHYFPHWGAREI